VPAVSYKPTLDDATLRAVDKFASSQGRSPSSTDLHGMIGGPLISVQRALARLSANGSLVRSGQARATRYARPRYDTAHDHRVAEPAPPESPQRRHGALDWSAHVRALRESLRAPLGARKPVTYARRFVDAYQPNQSSLLPEPLADALARDGRIQGQLPAGTYARKVLEQLLIDLSWSSSRLEGNTYSLLDTQALFERGVPTDTDGVMLLNHKSAIEYLVDAVPSYGLERHVVTNLHALLMRDLITDPAALGSIRRSIVAISGSVYTPTHMPQLLDEMLGAIVDKARAIKNPIEAAFFLWVNIAYLQPFQDGNKRASRLAANIPLMLYNAAPLAFLDVTPDDYALAMIGVYERHDVSIAAELFEWTYRRSMARYKVVLDATGAADPFRLKHRETLNQAVARVVRDGQSAKTAIEKLAIDRGEREAFARLLDTELAALGPHNSARYRLSPMEVEAWVKRASRTRRAAGEAGKRRG
jgi:fido (protein-threonine AMPylation protein)